MAQPAVKKLNMVILMQPDVEAAVAFYEQLGLQKIFHLKDKWAEMRIGETKLGLCPTSQSVDAVRTGVVFEVDNVREMYDTHKDAVNFLAAPKEAIHGIMVAFKDPGGNLLDLYQPTPERVSELARKVKEQDECGDKPAQGGCCKQKKAAPKPAVDDTTQACC